MTHQWLGVIEEYRDRLDIPERTPTITLREGGTPLVDSQWLSRLTGGEVWLKVEGDNPTGSFKDRGMTVAISMAASVACSLRMIWVIASTAMAAPSVAVTMPPKIVPT